VSRQRRARTVWHSPDGLCYELRTHFTKSKAEQIAKSFAKNRRFERAVARPVKDGVYAVRLYPASLTRLYEACERRSREKAAEEFRGMEAVARPDGSGWDVYNAAKKSQRWYFVSREPFTCECRDWQTRKSRIGACCKHQHFLRMAGYLETELELVG
jgi:hypothetical protein